MSAIPPAAPLGEQFVRARLAADQQIAFWQHADVSPDEAWRALGGDWGWAVDWWEVRALIVHWQLAQPEFQQGEVQHQAEPDCPDRLAA